MYQECKDELAANYDIVVLDKSPLNNTYTIAVQPETAEEYGLVTIADLQKCDDQLVIGTTLEFQTGLMMGCRVWWPSTDSSLRIP